MTQPSPDDIILHHYETSPFSEKVRIFLGLKGASWRSVLIPSIMPKPLLTPLTGGYRRTPVMQIGADIYCDTQSMLARIEAVRPSPPAIAPGDWVVNLWADRPFFQVTVPVVFGGIGRNVPPEFIKDREALSGRPFDIAGMQAMAGPLAHQYRGHCAFIEQGLSTSPWLAGDKPGLADAAAYMNLWFLERSGPDLLKTLLSGLTRTQDWQERVRALGHGERSELSGEAALELARGTEPADHPDHDPTDPSGLQPGDLAFVMADDYGRDRIVGRLVAANARSVTLARTDDQTGLVHVHFPRVGYIVGRAA